MRQVDVGPRSTNLHRLSALTSFPTEAHVLPQEDLNDYIYEGLRSFEDKNHPFPGSIDRSH